MKYREMGGDEIEVAEAMYRAAAGGLRVVAAVAKAVRARRVEAWAGEEVRALEEVAARLASSFVVVAAVPDVLAPFFRARGYTVRDRPEDVR